MNAPGSRVFVNPPLQDERQDDRRFQLAACALVVLAALAAYGNAFRAALLFDNTILILEDPRIQVWEWSRIKDILFGDYFFGLETNAYRPLSTLSYAVNYTLLGCGDKPAGYIATNLLIHVLNGWMVIALARRLGLSKAVALFAGALFTVHPLGTEAVTNVIGRSDLLAAAGVLAGTLLHARVAFTDRHRLSSSLGILSASALAIGSKESGIVLVGVLVLYDVLFAWPRESSRDLGAFVRARLTRSYAWCLLPVAAYFGMRSIALAGERLLPLILDNPLLLLGPVEARMTAAGVLVRYVGLTLWPSTLSADYAYDSVPVFTGALHGPSDWLYWLAAPLLCATVVGAIVLRRRAPVIAFCLLFFFVTVAPVSNVFMLIGTIMAERIVYLPSVGVFLLVSSALVGLLASVGRRAPKPVLAWAEGAAAVALIAGLAYRSAVRNLDWRSGVDLFTAAVRVHPRSSKAHRLLAEQLSASAQNDEEMRLRIDSIVDHTETAWKILQELPPTVGYSNALWDLASYYRLKAGFVSDSERKPWLDRAEFAYRQAIQSGQSAGLVVDWRVQLGLAELLREEARNEEALACFQAALDLAPGPEVLEPYAELLSASGRPQDALMCVLRLLTLQPEHEGAWNYVSASYAQRLPGEQTVDRSEGGWRINTGHPVVGAELRTAARQQHAALVKLGRSGNADQYIASLADLFGFEFAGSVVRR